jgi:amino acid transporter
MGAPAARNVSDKGLKAAALSFFSSVAIGVSSTSPAYSLASTLGFISAYVAFGTPAIMIAAFVPMLLIAIACYRLNRADPDCGTTFSWVTRAMGPHLGWMGGWSIIVSDIIVMPNLAAVAGTYSFALLDINNPPTVVAILVGVAWIAVMTAICYLGIELSARTQQLLVGAELALLAIFSIVALAKVYGGGAPATAHHVSPAWFDPFHTGSLKSFTAAMLLTVFIYWGWDTSLSVNEETENPRAVPGRAAVVSTVALVVIYTAVAVAAIAFGGPDQLSSHHDDVFAALGDTVLGPQFDKLLTLAVLISAVASAQTTILPTARVAVSMASAGALPKKFADIHPRYRVPGFATLVMGGVSIVWYITLTILSQNVLNDSLLALGIIISFYYALTGFACVIFYRRVLFSSFRNLFFTGVLPGIGALTMLDLLIETCLALGKGSAGATTVFSVGGPLVIGVGALLLGVLLMVFVGWNMPDFFRHRVQSSSTYNMWC